MTLEPRCKTLKSIWRDKALEHHVARGFVYGTSTMPSLRADAANPTRTGGEHAPCQIYTPAPAAGGIPSLEVAETYSAAFAADGGTETVTPSVATGAAAGLAAAAAAAFAAGAGAAAAAVFVTALAALVLAFLATVSVVFCLAACVACCLIFSA